MNHEHDTKTHTDVTHMTYSEGNTLLDIYNGEEMIPCKQTTH